MNLLTNTKCTIHGCARTFQERSQAELHSANTWHCLACGFSDGAELTDINIGTTCNICEAKQYTSSTLATTSGCKLLVFVDFKAKKRILYIRRL